MIAKRVVDIAGSALALLVLSPVLGILAFFVRLRMGRPVLFRQVRPGWRERPFTIYKFRTMRNAVDASGSPLPDGERLDPFGSFLRRTSLDELPEFWNVLRGDMSLVGPRPELPFYVQVYTEEQRCVFSVRPGITDPATLEYCNEEEILAAAPDRERFYTEVVLPNKLRFNLDYLQRISFRFDLFLILITLRVTFLRVAPRWPLRPIPITNISDTYISAIHAKANSQASNKEGRMVPGTLSTQNRPGQENHVKE
jgi:lipopolysaccharide/colanic/teichoic acid biosynthesis glycosyltransferase